MIEGTSDNFEQEVLKADKPVLVDFNADWCGPCQMMKPIVEDFAKNHDNCKVVSVNIDEEDILAAKYEISSIPCIVVFKDGEEVARKIGVQSAKKLEKMLGE